MAGNAITLTASSTLESGSRLLRSLLFAALILEVLQISLGGIVRVTGSGDACPDWPLCFGRIIPPLNNVNVILEWTHRASGTVLGAITVLCAVLVWLARSNKRLAWLTTSILILVAIVGGLGGGVVLTELSPILRTLHLMLAEITVLVTVWAFVASSHNGLPVISSNKLGPTGKLLMQASVITLIALLSGSYTVLRSAGTACDSWPLCTGFEFPRSTIELIHIFHRVISGTSVIVGMYAVIKSLRLPEQSLQWKLIGYSTLIFIFAQVFIGAANPWTSFDAWARAAHLSLATVVWVFLCLMWFIEWKNYNIRIDSNGSK